MHIVQTEKRLPVDLFMQTTDQKMIYYSINPNSPRALTIC